ncbi:MAG: 8-amino-7-oxononanoate synthase [Planctomycetota bacterium]|nr:MAG: 8-amino-7-oxononanoate synthase [Planctomycetota bacterium]
MEYGEKLDELERAGRLRTLLCPDHRAGCRVRLDDSSLLNLSSNDYLGVAADIDLHREFYRGAENLSLEHFGLGAASSRLLTGDSRLQRNLEDSLSRMYGGEAVLLFNSGYHANIGILPALFGKGDLILSDKLNHASLHDGQRLSLATVKRFRHRDYRQVEEILRGCRSDYGRCVIVTESVFSMDGDVADLAELVRLKRDYSCLLCVDEAHGVGVHGARGLGQSEAQNVLGGIDLLLGTFGKAYGGMGAFLVCSTTIRSFLINHSRSLIFTTALPPVVIKWNLMVAEKMASFSERRSKLLELSKVLRRGLQEQGLQSSGSTHIVPVLIGEASRTVRAAELLRERGYFVLPVRPPTVPEGSSRFRLSLRADLEPADIADLPLQISEVLGSMDRSRS